MVLTVRLILMNALKMRKSATMEFVRIFVVHINAFVVQALVVITVRPTSKNVYQTHVKTVGLVKTLSTILYVYVLQDLKVCDDTAQS